MTDVRTAVVGSTRVVSIVSDRPLTRGRPAEFRRHGLALSALSTATGALKKVGSEPHVVLLVPTELPDMPLADFLDIVRSLSTASVLVAVGDDLDAVKAAFALQHGAAGLIGLPVTPIALAQAVHAMPRHTIDTRTSFECGDLVVDVASHRVWWRGEPVHLPPREFSMMAYLAQEYPRLVTIEELVSELGAGRAAGAPERMRHMVSRIRAYFLEATPDVPPPVETVYRVGYRLTP